MLVFMLGFFGFMDYMSPGRRNGDTVGKKWGMVGAQWVEGFAGLIPAPARVKSEGGS